MFQLEPLPPQVCRGDAVLGLQHYFYLMPLTANKTGKSLGQLMLQLGKQYPHP